MPGRTFNAAWFQELAATLGVSHVDLSSIVVKLCYCGHLLLVLVILTWLSETTRRQPARWERTSPPRHLQVFVLGSAVIGIAGANADHARRPVHARLLPAAMRFTFLI